MHDVISAYAYKIISDIIDQLTDMWQEHPELKEYEIAEVEERVQQISDHFHVLAEGLGYYKIEEERGAK